MALRITLLLLLTPVSGPLHAIIHGGPVGGSLITPYKPDSVRLIEASKAGNLELVQQLLTTKTNPNSKDMYGVTPLIYAAMHNHVSIVRLLIKNGAEINIQNRWGLTALMFAAESGHTHAVLALISAGADLNLKNEDNFTALRLAVRHDKTQTMDILIAAGAPLDSLLSEYKHNESKQQSEKLFACARTVFTFPHHVNYAQRHADEVAQIHTLARLLKEQPLRLNFIDPQGNTLLHNALLSGNRVTISLLLYYMITYNMAEQLEHRNKKERLTPVHLAVIKGGAWLLRPFFNNIAP